MRAKIKNNMRTKVKKKKLRTLRSPEFEHFLKTPLKRYKGQYVAILGSKVVASGKDAKEVWEKARKKYPKKLPTLAKLPKEETLVLKVLWK